MGIFCATLAVFFPLGLRYCNKTMAFPCSVLLKILHVTYYELIVSFKNDLLKSQPPQNMTLFGNSVFTEVIEVIIQYDKSSHIKKFGHSCRHTLREDDVNTHREKTA